MAAALPQLTVDPEVKAEIHAAVATGKFVTVSQAPITVGTWTGVGYIIIDPETGAGAYKISGGANGAFLQGMQAGFLTLLLIIMILALLPAIGTTAGLFVASGPLLGHIAVLITGLFLLYVELEEDGRPCFWSGFVGSLLALAIVGLLAYGSRIFREVREKRCKAFDTAAKKSPIVPEFALVMGSEPSNGDKPVSPPRSPFQ